MPTNELVYGRHPHPYPFPSDVKKQAQDYEPVKRKIKSQSLISVHIGRIQARLSYLAHGIFLMACCRNITDSVELSRDCGRS